MNAQELIERLREIGREYNLPTCRKSADALEAQAERIKQLEADAARYRECLEKWQSANDFQSRIVAAGFTDIALTQPKTTILTTIEAEILERLADEFDTVCSDSVSVFELRRRAAELRGRT